MKKNRKNIIIFGINADIGFNLAKLYSKQNYNIIGSFRCENNSLKILKKYNNVKLIKCDFSTKKNLKAFVKEVDKTQFQWDEIFSSIGSTKPIGKFFNLEFSGWKKSIDLNFIKQMELIHMLYDFRNQSSVVNINLMAGGGTNSVFKNYSAYCISKICLIKMCELIDDENPDIKIQIIGPGFVKTKIHNETLDAGMSAGTNLKKVQNFLNSSENGTKFEDIFNCIQWLNKSEKKITSGRNFSVVHDNWGDDKLINQLRNDKNMYKLRRFRN